MQLADRSSVLPNKSWVLLLGSHRSVILLSLLCAAGCTLWQQVHGHCGAVASASRRAQCALCPLPRGRWKYSTLLHMHEHSPSIHCWHPGCFSWMPPAKTIQADTPKVAATQAFP
jgi:hypothetical protein